MPKIDPQILVMIIGLIVTLILISEWTHARSNMAQAASDMSATNLNQLQNVHPINAALATTFLASDQSQNNQSTVFTDAQLESTTVPAGYQKDTGAVYIASLRYGWNIAMRMIELTVKTIKLNRQAANN